MSVETEFKFLIKKIPNIVLKDITKKYQFTQIYFNGEKKLNLLKSIFPDVDLNTIHTFRIRHIVNNNQSYNVVTLKTKGGISRNEYEKEIDETICKSLYDDNIVTMIIKNRYKNYYNDYCFEFDEYLNLKEKLFTCEVEVNNDIDIDKQYREILMILKDFYNIDYSDVTNDNRYKNSNLIKYFG